MYRHNGTPFQIEQVTFNIFLIILKTLAIIEFYFVLVKETILNSQV